VGYKKGIVYTKILSDKDKDEEVTFIGTAKIPPIYKYLKIERLLPHPWAKK